jgi:phage FluMu protein Com
MDLPGIIDLLCRSGVCRACNTSLARASIRQLRHQGQNHLVELTCPRCQQSFLTRITLIPEPASNLPKSPYTPPIAADELLDLHAFLSEHQGDLRSLVSRNEPAPGSA